MVSDEKGALSIVQKRGTLGIVRRFHQCILFMLLSKPSVHEFLTTLERQEGTEWSDLKSRLADRASNIGIVGGLAVTATAAFLTTSPPTTFAEWHHDIPYFFTAATAGFAMLAVMSGFGLAMYLDVLCPDLATELRKSKLKRMAAVLLLMMPNIFLFSAAACVVTAWLTAMWFGSTFWMKLVMTIGCGIAFPMTIFVIITLIY